MRPKENTKREYPLTLYLLEGIHESMITKKSWFSYKLNQLIGYLIIEFVRN